MSFFDAMILGIVQGLTEFLPVSSSGHLVILENLLNIRTDTDVLFHVLLHFGTLIAICLVFKNDLFRMLVETIHIFQDLTAKCIYCNRHHYDSHCYFIWFHVVVISADGRNRRPSRRYSRILLSKPI